MYTYFKVKAYFKGHDFERMDTVVALAPKPLLTTAVIDADDPLGGHGVEDRLDGKGGNDKLWRLRDTRKSRRWRDAAKQVPLGCGGKYLQMRESGVERRVA